MLASFVCVCRILINGYPPGGCFGWLSLAVFKRDMIFSAEFAYSIHIHTCPYICIHLHTCISYHLYIITYHHIWQWKPIHQLLRLLSENPSMPLEDEFPARLSYPLVISHSCGKSPFLMETSTTMIMFNSYAKLPEGIKSWHFWMFEKIGFGTVRFRSPHTNPKDWDYPPGFLPIESVTVDMENPWFFGNCFIFMFYFSYVIIVRLIIVIKFLCIFRLRYLVGKQLHFCVDRTHAHPTLTVLVLTFL